MLLAVIVLAIPTTGNAWSLFGTKNYDDCILENISAGMSNSAVRAVKQSCRRKFPRATSTCREEKLNPEQLAEISLKYNYSKRSYEIYNNNSFSVLNIKIAFTTNGREHPIIKELSPRMSYTSFDKKNYTDVMYVPDDFKTFQVLSATTAKCGLYTNDHN